RPEAPRPVVLLGSDRRPGAARELHRAHRQATEGAVLTPHERALGRADALEHAAADDETAPHLHGARDLAIPEDLVVVVALFVAIKEAAHGSVAPVHDANAALRVEVRPATDEHFALSPVLAEDEPAEVRRARVDVRLGRLAPARGEALQPLHLLHQRRDVLEPRLSDLIPELEQPSVVVPRVSRCSRRA